MIFGPPTSKGGSAAALDKNIVPILIADGIHVDLLPPDLARIQLVDYRLADKLALLKLLKTLTRLPAPRPLPSPLPPPPAIPISYLSALRVRIEAEQLPAHEQAELVLTLKRGLKDQKTRGNAVVLLRRLRTRHDLLAWISEEIDELLESPSVLEVATSEPRVGRTVSPAASSPKVRPEADAGPLLSPQSLADCERAAEAGDVNAQLALAQMYAEGVNGNVDYASAAKWNMRAAKTGNRDAQYHLAVLYAFGRSVNRNRKTAVEWFSQDSRERSRRLAVQSRLALRAG